MYLIIFTGHPRIQMKIIKLLFSLRKQVVLLFSAFKVGGARQKKELNYSLLKITKGANKLRIKTHACH